jgi:hypothetical protein
MTTLKLSRDQRDAIYGEVMVDLSSLGDLYLFLQEQDYDKAREYRRRHEQNLRVLDDLGWEVEPEPEPGSGDEFEITMPTGELVDMLRRLNESAGQTIHRHVVEPIEATEAEITLRAVRAQTAYTDILGQLLGL